MTWTLIKQDVATDNINLLSKLKTDLTIDTTYFTVARDQALFTGQELVLQNANSGMYLNIAAMQGQNPFDGDLFSGTSPIQDIFACYMTANYNATETFAQRFSSNFPYSHSGIMFFDAAINNYYIYKNDETELFLFVVEWSTGIFDFMVFGEAKVASENNNLSCQIFATNGEFYTNDTSVSVTSDFRPIFNNDSFFSCYLNGAFINQNHGTAGWSTEFDNLRINVDLFNTSSTGELPNFSSRSGQYNKSSTFACSRTKFNDKHIPLPIYIYANRSESRQAAKTVIGFIPDLFYICYDTIATGEEITYGSRTVKCFPNYQKTTPTDWSDNITRASGIAIRTS